MDATTWTEFAPSIEWMCHQFRRQTGPLPGEVAWHHAVVALAERVDDMWFLVPQEGRGKGADHLSHALSRFPDDSRLAFARVYAVMRTDRRDLNRRARTGPKPTLGGNRAYFRDKTLDAIAALRVYTSDPIVGAEAELRIAQMYFVVYDYDDAITHAAEASAKSRDAARRYQAAMLTGLAFERLSRFQEAGRAFAAALVIVPNGQSAALSLAPLLLLAGAQPQADAMVTASLAARPMADDDPWRLMQYGDYVRWPDIVADLRSALR